MSQHASTASKIVATVRQNFNKGTTKTLPQRKSSLKNLLKFFEENENAIVDAVFADSRRPREETRVEIFTVLSHLRYLLDNVQKWSRPEKASKRWVDLLDGVYVYNDPFGVVLVMTCWNMPILTLIPIAGAIAAGNCVVVKPSHNGPNFGHFLATTLPKYLDPEFCPVFWASRDDTPKLLEQRFDYIYFTGSPSVGKIIHNAASKHLTPTTLQMGGKNPVYIDSTADLELAAARIIWGKCLNSGQVCSAPDYILCSKPVEEGFIKHAKTAIEKFFPDSKHCPIVNDHHCYRLSKLLQGLDIALGGGTDLPQRTMEPTIAVNVSPDHPIMQEEIFGPILPIVTVNSLDEAVDFVNRREKPLVIYLFTKNKSAREFFIDNTSSGAVTINDTLMHVIVESLPFGGVGSSGMGRYKAKYSFDTFVNKRSVLVKNSWRVVEKVYELRYPPYTKRKTDMINFLNKYRGGPSWESVFWLVVFLLGVVAGFVLFYVVVGLRA